MNEVKWSIYEVRLKKNDFFELSFFIPCDDICLISSIKFVVFGHELMNRRLDETIRVMVRAVVIWNFLDTSILENVHVWEELFH